jgi:hypothetical protein
VVHRQYVQAHSEVRRTWTDPLLGNPCKCVVCTVHALCCQTQSILNPQPCPSALTVHYLGCHYRGHKLLQTLHLPYHSFHWV